MTDTELSPGAIERLVAGQHHDPHSILGAHPGPEGVVVRALRPLGASVAVILDGGRRFPMTHLDRGVFTVTLPEEKVPDYRLATVYPGEQGDEAVADDPYRYLPTLGEFDLYLIGEGRHEELWRVLGAHVREVGPATGTSFAVWAPNALGVRVTGDFNYWDGRAFPMRSLGGSGVWDPGPGHAQLAADLGVGQALSCPGAGLPQPGGAEDRRAAHLVDQAPGAVLAVAGADPRHLGGLDAERGGDGLALEAAALGERADRQVPHLQVAGAEGRQQHRAGVHRDRAAVAGAGDGQRPGQRHAGELLSAHAVSILPEDHNLLIFRPLYGAGFLSSQWPFRTAGPTARSPVGHGRASPGGPRLSGRQIAGIPTSTAGPRTPGQAKDSLTITGGL